MSVIPVPMARVVPNPDQPRKAFPAEHIAELAASIKAEGLLQPITVRRLPTGDFEIVAGECRWRAHKLLNAATIQADVREMSDRQRDVMAIVENMQRQDVSPLEEARALRRLVEQGMSVAELSESTGAPAYKIEWRLTLFRLSAEILQLFERGHITLQHAQELARLPGEADQRRMLQRINRGEITGHRTLHNAIDAVLDGMTVTDLFGDAPRATPADVEKLNGMEAKIQRVAEMVAAGWKDGECVTAAKVSPDRARLMADKLKHARIALAKMESDLRQTVSQADVVMELVA
jgi:ParB family chromosome partitioning protein